MKNHISKYGEFLTVFYDVTCVTVHHWLKSIDKYFFPLFLDDITLHFTSIMIREQNKATNGEKMQQIIFQTVKEKQ